jgi:hypothetical protein
LRSEAASIEYRIAGVVRRRWMIWLFVPLYALMFGEMFVRILAPAPVIPRYVTGAAYGVRVGMPNMRFHQTTPETRVEIRTNSRGIRADREFAYAKPAGTCRVVLLGDSLLVGYEVDLEDSFSYLLEKRLLAEGYRCEVINLAVSGFGTAEMLVTLREEGLKYHPDLVLFSSHVTDLDDNVRSSLYALDAAGALVRDQRTFLPGIRLSDELSSHATYRWMVENSQLYSAIRERASQAVKAAMVNLERPQARKKEKEHAATAAAVDSARGYSWRLTLALLEEAKRVSDSAGARFCVLELPFSVSRTEIVRMLPEYGPGETEKLNLISPLASLRAAARSDRKLFFEKGHGHLTPAGNRLVTGYFFDELTKTGWLDSWKK